MNNISWSFTGNKSVSRAANGLFDARAIHWYPATYIPEIPYSLIELLSKPGDKVLDPFAGIGTTLWQALALGREAYGAELTLVGQNAASDIWSLLAANTDLGAAQDQVLSVLRQWDGFDFTAVFLDSVRGQLLEPWFSPGTLRELAFIAGAEAMMSIPAASHLLRLSTSAILANVSEQRRGWGCIADNMKPRVQDLSAAPTSRGPIEKVIQKAKSIVKLVSTARNQLTPYDHFQAQADDASTHLFGGDCIDSGALSREGFYDLIVTSPPYPAMVDYSTAQRLSYYWQGVLPERDVSKEIGARRRRFASRSLNDYTTEMTKALQAMSQSIKVGGMIAMVIPVFSSSGDDDPRAIALRNVFESEAANRLELTWQTDRILPTNRRQLNQKWTSLRRENIRVYERRQ